MSDTYDIINPGAAAMIESLRAYGYSLNTAVADLIDNSISANAGNIWITLNWDGENSWIAITDDGNGMDEAKLVNAMRPGSNNPLDERSEHDLGRFGLGLKTASFSQARILTVASRQGGEEQNLRRWDLDYVGKHNEWRLLRTPRPGSDSRLRSLESVRSGTVVLLEDLDRLCYEQKSADVSQRRKFFSRIESLKQHLSMVFHRFMAAREGINIFINGRDREHQLEPWDPFLSDMKATMVQPQELKRFSDGTVTVRGYVLPHKDKLSSTEHGSAAGPGGWNDQQGFYIYRNKRLLVSGSWLGLGGRRQGWIKEEHYKLARIKVDIPNNMDSAWQIDVKKSTAVPPPLVAEWLETYAGHVRKSAREVFSHRGQYGGRNAAREIVKLWKPGMRNGSRIYRIDRKSNLVRQVLEEAAGVRSKVELLLKMLEETVPVQQIWLDIAEHPERSNEALGGYSESEVLDLVHGTILALIGPDRRPTETDIEYICSMEGFAAYADIIRAKYLGVEN